MIDLQGAQGANRHLGIGRYSLALAEAMARNAGGHEVWIALNAVFRDTIEDIRAALDALVPQEQIVVWESTHASRWYRSNCMIGAAQAAKVL